MKLDGLSIFHAFIHLFWLANLALFVFVCWLVAIYGFSWLALVSLAIIVVFMAYATNSITSLRRNYNEIRVFQALNQALEAKDFKRHAEIIQANRHMDCIKKVAAFWEGLRSAHKHDEP